MLVLQVREWIADLGKSALVHTARFKNSPAKGLKSMVTKVQWLCWRRMSIIKEQGDLLWMLTHQIHDNWVAYSRIWSPPKSSSILREELRHTEIDPVCKIHKKPLYVTLTFETNPSLGMICPGELHQRNPNAPKIWDRVARAMCPWSSVEAGTKYSQIKGEK